MKKENRRIDFTIKKYFIRLPWVSFSRIIILLYLEYWNIKLYQFELGVLLKETNQALRLIERQYIEIRRT